MISQKSPIDEQLSPHPCANLFPMLNDDDLQMLADDIEQNGQREPIVFWGRWILDGRNRLRACQLKGIKCKTVDLSDEIDDPLAYVISANLHRRQLSSSQRAIIAGQLCNLKPGQVGNGRRVGGQNCPSTSDAAKSFNISTTSVKTAKVVLRSQDKELIADVKEGRSSVNRAAKRVRRPQRNSNPKQERTLTDFQQRAIEVLKLGKPEGGKATDTCRLVLPKEQELRQLLEQLTSEEIKQAVVFARYSNRNVFQETMARASAVVFLRKSVRDLDVVLYVGDGVEPFVNKFGNEGHVMVPLSRNG